MCESGISRGTTNSTDYGKECITGAYREGPGSPTTAIYGIIESEPSGCLVHRVSCPSGPSLALTVWRILGEPLVLNSFRKRREVEVGRQEQLCNSLRLFISGSQLEGAAYSRSSSLS